MDGGPESTAPTWQQSQEWKEYKELHAAASAPRTVTEMEAVEARIRRRSGSLSRIFPNDHHMVATLGAFLFDVAHMRRLELQTTRGRPAPRDENRNLDEFLGTLDERFAALRGLREAGGTDPWIAAEVEALVAHSCEAAEETLKRIDRKKPDAAALARRTREAVGKVRAWLEASGTRG
jgi:hypothetical protein